MSIQFQRHTCALLVAFGCFFIPAKQSQAQFNGTCPAETTPTGIVKVFHEEGPVNSGGCSGGKKPIHHYRYLYNCCAQKFPGDGSRTNDAYAHGGLPDGTNTTCVDANDPVPDSYAIVPGVNGTPGNHPFNHHAGPCYVAHTFNCGDGDFGTDPVFQGQFDLCDSQRQKEICNNGVDDNGNGQTDEGCGSGKGGGNSNQASNTCAMNRSKPVNLMTGNMTITHTDFRVETGGIPFVFRRTYNSDSDYTLQSVGAQWQHNYATFLKTVHKPHYSPGTYGQPNANVFRHEVRLPSGTTVSFDANFAPGTGLAAPKKGSAGYKLQKIITSSATTYVLTTPKGMSFHFNADRYITKQVDRAGNYLTFGYKSFRYWKHNSNWSTKYLTVVKAYLKDGTLLPKALYFGYNAGEAPDMTASPQKLTYMLPELKNIVVGPSTNPTTCTVASGSQTSGANSGCGTGTGGQCASSLNEHLNPNTTSTWAGTWNGFCGKPLVEYTYEKKQGWYGLKNVGSNSFYRAHRTYYRFGSDGNQSSCVGTNCTTTKRDLIEYSYVNHSSQNHLLTAAKDATGTILERHTYNSDNRVIRSETARGDLKYTYKLKTKTTEVEHFGVVGKEAVTWDPTTGGMTKRTGTCSCTNATVEQSWKTVGEYILRKDNQILLSQSPLDKAYNNFEHVLNSDGILIKQMITYSDNDTDGSNTLPALAHKFEFHYLPQHPDLLWKLERQSARGGNYKRQIIMDYDASNTSTTQFNQNPTKLVHRIIHKGWTIDPSSLGGSTVTWKEEIRITTFQYDSNNRMIKILGPRSGQETQFVYYGGGQGDNSYMLHKLRRRAHNPLTDAETWLETVHSNYNAFGEAGTIVDESGVTIKRTFDDMGRITEVQRQKAGGTGWLKTTYTLDDAGRLSSLTKPNGGIMKYSYDNFGRRIKISFKADAGSPEQDLVSNIYDQGGRLISVKDHRRQAPNGQDYVSKYVYTYVVGSGQRVKYYPAPHYKGDSDPKARFTLSESRLDGSVTKQIDANGQETQYTYHPGRPWVKEVKRKNSTTGQFEITATYQYDREGRVIEIKDARGIATTYQWDDFDQKIKLVSADRAPANAPMMFSYDESGNLVKAQQPVHGNLAVTNYSYDSLNRLVKVDYPAPQDNLGGLLVDGDITLTYDQTSYTTQGGHSITNSYGKGKLSWVSVQLFRDTSNNEIVSRTTYNIYDRGGRVISQRIEDKTPSGSATDYTTNYAHDDEGQLVGIQNPVDDVWYRYTRSSAGQIKTMKLDDGGTQTDLYTRSHLGPGGPLAEHNQVLTNAVQPGNGPSQTRSSRKFSPTQLLSEHTNGHLQSLLSSNTLTGQHRGLLHRVYEHDKRGYIVKYSCSTNAAGSIGSHCHLGNFAHTFNYDYRNRLTQATVTLPGVGTNTHSYQYDANGNRTLSSATQPSFLSWDYSYDSASNRIKKRYETGTSAPSTDDYEHGTGGRRLFGPYRQYLYHGHGRIALVTPKSGYSGEPLAFFYDHRGHVVRKVELNSGYSTLYFYDKYGRRSTEFKANTQGNGGTWRSYLWMGGSLVGVVHNEEQNGNASSDVISFFNDHVGKPVVAVDSLGLPAWRANADPFGKDLGVNIASTKASTENTLSPTETDPLRKIVEFQSGVGTQSSNAQEIRANIPSGAYAIQFYFETLTGETGSSTFQASLVDSDGLNPQLAHLFTGNHQTGAFSNPGTAFWGPVIRFHANFASGAAAQAAGKMLFEALGSYGVNAKITKYRLFNIASGQTKTISVSDSPEVGGTGLYANDLGATPGSPPWSKSYQRSGAFMSRACFTDFNVEYHYDRVEIRDKDNHIIQVMTGNLGNICSAWVKGDEIKVLLFSDFSVQGNFTVSSIESVYPTEVKARFPGQWYEKDTEVRDLANGNLLYAGLHYNWFRFYDPELGRYTSPDPLGMAAGMNPYVYALNNPINIGDPDGALPVVVGVFIAGALTGSAWAFMGQLHEMFKRYRKGEAVGCFDWRAIGWEGLKEAVFAVAGLGAMKLFLRIRRAPTLAGKIIAGKGDDLAEAAKRVKPIDGYYDVAIHGNKHRFYPDLINKENMSIDHRALARIIKNDPNYKGGNIRLLSCNTGACGATAAQNLANKMNVHVKAPDNFLWIYPMGGTIIAPRRRLWSAKGWIYRPARNRQGSWQPFRPGGNK